jgi:hypothetical protein
MMRVIDRVVSVIGLCHCGDVVRVVEPCSIWRGRFSLTIPRIESIHGWVGLTSPRCLGETGSRIVSSVLSGISSWGFRRGERSLSMVVRWL